MQTKHRIRLGYSSCPIPANDQPVKPWRLLTLMLVVYICYVGLLATSSNVGFPESMATAQLFPYLADKPVGEDGYYMLTVAWNLAEGRGLSYTFEKPTTGIQPLATILYGILARITKFAGGDQWTFIRLVIVIGGVILLLTAHAVGRLSVQLIPDAAIHRKDVYNIAFVLVAFNFALFRWFTYGLETGIYLLLVVASVAFSIRHFRQGARPLRSIVTFSLLTALTIWARIDFAIVLLVFLVMSLSKSLINLREFLQIGALNAVVVIPWFAYTYWVTGHWIPSSGGAQASLASTGDYWIRLTRMAAALVSHLTPWFYSNAQGLFTVGAFLSFLVLLLLLLSDKHVRKTCPKILDHSPQFRYWTLGILVLTAVYPIAFWATHFYQRYTVPVIVPITVLLAICITVRLKTSPRLLYKAVLIIVPALFFFWTLLSLHTGRISNTHVITAGYLLEHYPEDKVGAFQSGVIGFFNPNAINLDGKIDHVALEYLRQGSLHEYIDQESIAVIVDWPGMIQSHLKSDWLLANWHECENPIPNGISICLERNQTSTYPEPGAPNLD